MRSSTKAAMIKVTHDVLCHDIVGLGAVSKTLAENSIAKGSFINADELTASRETVDFSCNAGLEHSTKALSLRVLNRLIQGPVAPVVAIKIDTDVATHADDLGVLANLLDHLPDTVLVKHGICVHTSKVRDIIKTSVDEVVADVLEEKRSREAQTVAFTLVVALSDKHIRNALVEASLCLDRHEQSVASTVCVLEGARWAWLEDILEEVVLRSLLHTRTPYIAVDNDEDNTRMIVDVLLRNQRIKRARQLLVGLVVARQKQDHLLRLSRNILLGLPPEAQHIDTEPMEHNAETHKCLKNGVGAEKDEEEVVHLVVLPSDIDEGTIDASETNDQTPFL
ncbi:hypothetical protein HG530_003776 [Fusarium avenaceum]|nr:hypothetical protein HG530_003776 [Fusarium avenaceum]